MSYQRGTTYRVSSSWTLFLPCLLASVLLLIFSPSTTAAQEAAATPDKSASADVEAQPAANSDALRKAAQNPVASMVSVPVQNNDNTGITPGYRTQNVLNIQPVIPLKLNNNWNLIVRWITPIVYTPIPSAAGAPELGASGLGDMQPTFFFSPSKPSKLIWGAGPIFQLPTATSQFTGQGKLGVGPNIVALTMPKNWVIGALVNNLWSIAGSGSRPDVNQFLLQYFINYNMKKGWYFTAQPVVTANWNATSGNVWTVPFGGGMGRVMKLGFQPVNINVQAYANAIAPSGASTWGVRATFALLFPKLTKKQQMMMMEMKLKEMQAQDSAPPQKK